MGEECWKRSGKRREGRVRREVEREGAGLCAGGRKGRREEGRRRQVELKP